jgi:hypothetical protein
MAVTTDRIGQQARPSLTGNPLWPLAALVVVLPLLLVLPLTLPMGAMYWDSYVYIEAAQRIFSGEVPNVDFYGPVGPLGYYLFAAGLRLFPHAQPLLLLQWSMLVVTGPAMALVVHDVARRSRLDAWALLVPFLAFALIPINTLDFSLYPGFDGFGTYNRHTSELLYVLAATLLFVRGRVTQAILLAILLTALFLSKITGFAVGGLIVAFAFVAGRIPIRTALAVALAFVAVLAGLQAAGGITIAYLAEIRLLLSENSGSIASRFFTVASQYFDVLAPAGLLVLLLLAAAFSRRRPQPSGRLAAFRQTIDQPWLWVAILALAGMAYETQNTGSQGFILLWPALLVLLRNRADLPVRMRMAVTVLVALIALPIASHFTLRTARAALAGMTNVALGSENLRNLGQVSAKGDFLAEADRERAWLVAHKDEAFLKGPAGDTNSYRPFAEIDYQVLWLEAADEAASAIRARETGTGQRFRTILSIDFVNVLPYLLDRGTTRFMSVGATPGRTGHGLEPATQGAIEATDLVLVPRCTATKLSTELLAMYQPALAGRQRFELTPCYDAYLKAGE